MKKVLRPAGNPVLLDFAPIDENLFDSYGYQLLQSGTASLAAAVAASIKLQGAQPSDAEVIVPAYTCPDLISAVLYNGARPILVDLAADSPFSSTEQILQKITDKTVAIVMVNFMGLAGDINPIKQACEKNHLSLIYDCAQWFPPDRDVQWPGTFNIVSFGRGKPVNLLHGGAVIFEKAIESNVLPELPVEDRSPFHDLIQSLKIRAYNLLLQPRVYGLASRLPGLHVGLTLYKPLDDLQSMNPYYAKLIKANIAKYHQQTGILQYLHQRIASISHPLLIQFVGEKPVSESTKLLRYPVLIKNRRIRDLFFDRTRDWGTSMLYRQPLNQISGLENTLDQNTHYPNAADFANHLVTLPCHDDIDIAVVDSIVESLITTLDESAD